jgi:hypothetical protein
MRVGVVLRRGAVLAQHFGLVALQNQYPYTDGVSSKAMPAPACWLVGTYRYKYTLQLLMLSMMKVMTLWIRKSAKWVVISDLATRLATIVGCVSVGTPLFLQRLSPWNHKAIACCG